MSFTKIELTNGRTFEGELLNGNPYKGILRYKNGTFFNGILDYNENEQKIIGYKYGTLTLPKHSDFFRGSYKGFSFYIGEYHFSNGDIIEGEFKNNRPLKGITYYENGEIFEGDYDEKGNILNGEFIYLNKNIYTGKFIRGKPSGKGTVKLYNGDWFKGTFEEGVPVFGKLIYKNKNMFEGNFEDGNPISGRFIYTNGDHFEGEFKDGYPYKGKYIYENGVEYVGEIDIYAEKQGIGTIRPPNGSEGFIEHMGKFLDDVAIETHIVLNNDRTIERVDTGRNMSGLDKSRPRTKKIGGNKTQKNLFVN